MWSEQPLFLTFKGWFNRNFSNQAAIALMITIIAVILIFIFFGAYLVPVFIGLVLAYLLLPVVRMLKKWHCPHSLAVIITYLLFVVAYVGIFFALVPFLIKQMTSLVEYMPELFRSSQAWLVALEKHFPEFFSSSSVDNISSQLSDQVAKLGQLALQFSLSTLPGLIQTLLYLILVPILVLFFIRDADQVGSWLQAYLPKERGLLSVVGKKMSAQISAYVRGRVLEMCIVGSVSVVTLLLFGMPYAILLGVLIGVSVIVPYVGAIVVTIPVVVIGLGKWGFDSQFVYMFVAYLIILGLDAYLLVPILFSGAMNMHPIVILVSVIFFGGMFGIWGVFFAIPLASVIQTILLAWPQTVESADG